MLLLKGIKMLDISRMIVEERLLYHKLFWTEVVQLKDTVVFWEFLATFVLAIFKILTISSSGAYRKVFVA